MDNSIGTFLPAELATLSLKDRPYELRHLLFGLSEINMPKETVLQQSPSVSQLSDGSTTRSSRWHFEAVASFHLIWWNQGSSSRKNISIWRPAVSQEMVYFGDIVVQGYVPVIIYLLINFCLYMAEILCE